MGRASALSTSPSKVPVPYLDKAIEHTEFFPPFGGSRLSSMLAQLHAAMKWSIMQDLSLFPCGTQVDPCRVQIESHAELRLSLMQGAEVPGTQT